MDQIHAHNAIAHYNYPSSHLNSNTFRSLLKYPSSADRYRKEAHMVVIFNESRVVSSARSRGPVISNVYQLHYKRNARHFVIRAFVDFCVWCS